MLDAVMRLSTLLPVGWRAEVGPESVICPAHRLGGESRHVASTTHNDCPALSVRDHSVGGDEFVQHLGVNVALACW